MFKAMRDFWWWMDYYAVEIALVLILGGMFVGFGWALLQPPVPYHSLTKNEWTCTETKVEKHVRLQATGKVTIPISTSREVCVSYKRNH